MSRSCKLAILSGSIFSNNMGCNALTYGTLNVLSEVAKGLNVEFEYYLLGNPFGGVVPPELESYKINFIDRLPDFSPKGLLRCAYHRNYAEKKRQANELKQVDVLMDNAWGDSFSDIYGQARFESVFRHFAYALKAGKPLILLPQTIGPFQSEKIKTKAKKMLVYASAVYARDPLSVDCVKQLLPGLDVHGTIDVAMFMQHTSRGPVETNGLKIGLNPSGLLWRGGYTGQNQFGLQSNYKKVIHDVIRQLLSIGGVSIELIGHDISGPNAGNGCDDYYVCKLLQREFPGCKVGPFFYSPIEAKSYISGLDLLIGSRMHCCIAAYSSGVPVFPLAYSRKFKGLFVEKLEYPYFSDLTKDTCEKIHVDLKNFVEQHKNIKAQMPERLRLIGQYKKDLVEHLSAKLSYLLQQ